MTFDELVTIHFNNNDDEGLNYITDSYMNWCSDNNQPDLFGEGEPSQPEFIEWFMLLNN